MNLIPRTSRPMFVVPGELKLRTFNGRNGPFRIGLLTCPIGQFVVKDAEFEQFRQGKYDGEFSIDHIFLKTVPSWGGTRTELRARLCGMKLSNVDDLDQIETRNFNVQAVDPIEEEQPETLSAGPVATEISASADPLIDTRPFGVEVPAANSSEGEDKEDAALFGELWPLPESFKLDSTLNRRVLRMQCTRLDALGYVFDELIQMWHRAPERKAA